MKIRSNYFYNNVVKNQYNINKFNRVFKYFLMLSIFFLIIYSLSAVALDIYVDDDGGQNYTTIQAAINAANPGDTIYVYNGTYNENVLNDGYDSMTPL